jgi:hypothetical protein
MATAVQVESIWNGLTDNSGQPLANGKVYCYYAGTSTPAPLYTSSDKTSQATNPLILDGYGRSQVWADGRLKFVVKTSADVTLYTLDNLLYGFDDSTVLWGGQSTGAANAQVVSVPATIGAYSTGQQVTFIAGYTNTGATTLQFNALAAASIVKGPTPSSLQAGDLIAGNVYTATYEAYSGTGRFRLSDYPTVADFQLSRAQYATSVSGATTITANLTPALIAYEAGMVVRFKAVGNSGAAPVTLNLNGLGAKTIQYQNAALVGGELGNGIVHQLMYDGTNFQLLNPINVATPLWGGTTGGTSTAYTIAPAPAITAYATGQRFSFKAHAANGATPTLAVNGLATKTIKRQGTALAGNEFIANDIVDVQYDGTDFQLLNVVPAPLFIDRTNSRVGIGTTAPTESLSIVAPAAGTASVSLRGNNTTAANEFFISSSTDGATTYVYNRANGPMILGTNNTERIRVTATGNVGIGNGLPSVFVEAQRNANDSLTRFRLSNTSSGSSAETIYELGNDTNVAAASIKLYGSANTGGSGANTLLITNGYAAVRVVAGTNGVQLALNGTSWSAVSDGRFKKNVKPLGYGLETVCALDPIRFDYASEESEDSKHLGFIAQQVAPYVPEAVNGDPETQLFLSPTDLVPVLVSAVKELNARVESLEARISELEA